MGSYAFDRSWGPEDERLAGLERQLDPVSWAAAEQVGLAAGWRCWEVGAGRGSIAAWLAERVTASGSLLVTDIDLSGLGALDQANVTVIRHDLERDTMPPADFDLIHARLVLEHLTEPAATVRRLAAALRCGGWLILEDADGLLFQRRAGGEGTDGDHRSLAAGRAGGGLEPAVWPAPAERFAAGRARSGSWPGSPHLSARRRCLGRRTAGHRANARSDPARGSQPGRP